MPRKHRTPESLALNRENQRRSRARHRELLEDLQRRVREYERRDGQATLEMQRVARVVNAENAALKGLLSSKGVASNEVEAHLQAAVIKSPIDGQPQMMAQITPQSAMPPLSVREDLAGTRESRLEPIREMQYDPRLDTSPYKMPSPAPSASSSIIASTPSAPASLPALTPVSCGSGPSPTTHMALPMPLQPKPCSPVVPLPRLSGTMMPDRSLPPLQPDLSRSPKRHGSSGGVTGLRLPMVLDKPPSMVQPELEHLPASATVSCYSQSNVKSKLAYCPASRPEQSPMCPSQTLPSLRHYPGHYRQDQTHCVEAANILARLRGHHDDSLALSTLGCADNRNCMIRNTDLLQLMD